MPTGCRRGCRSAPPTSLLRQVAEHYSRAVLAERKKTVPDSEVAPLGSLLRALAIATGKAPQVRDWLLSKLKAGPSCPAGYLANQIRALMDRSPLEVLDKTLEVLEASAKYETGPVCGEPLFCAVPKPRRYPLAKYIVSRRREMFDAVVLDEVHEYSGKGTAQTKAAHRFAALGKPVLWLTGSLMGGYASSLFQNCASLLGPFQDDFGRQDDGRFVEMFGYRRERWRPKKGQKPEPAAFGRLTDRELFSVTTCGESPGVTPHFIARYLMPHAILVHKDELDVELPACDERQVALEPECAGDLAVLEEYRRIERLLFERIAEDASGPLAGKLWSAMLQLPTYLDRCTDDLDDFVLRYPASVGGEIVAEAKMQPAERLGLKERWLQDTVRAHLSAGRDTMIFLSNTGTQQLPQRICRVLQQVPGCHPVFLDAAKVGAQKRAAWIDQHIVRGPCNALVVNPNAVRTGLNNLVGFSRAIWLQIDYSAQCWRQANGRLHRIGQQNDVEISFPFFSGTAQQVAVRLIAQKVSASLQVDGLGLQGALEASGAGDDEQLAAMANMAVGRAIYEAMRA